MLCCIMLWVSTICSEDIESFTFIIPRVFDQVDLRYDVFLAQLASVDVTCRSSPGSMTNMAAEALGVHAMDYPGWMRLQYTFDIGCVLTGAPGTMIAIQVGGNSNLCRKIINFRT